MQQISECKVIGCSYCFLYYFVSKVGMGMLLYSDFLHGISGHAERYLLGASLNEVHLGLFWVKQ